MGGKYKGNYFSGSTLKIIAMLSMLIDHIAAVLVDSRAYPELYGAMREIGRLAFPVFCFLIVEGYFNTKNVKKYVGRLLIFGVISEIPFDLAIFGRPGTEFAHQNVFFTLLTGLLVIWFIDTHKENKVLQGLVIFAGCLGATIIKTDYSFFGVAQIVIFYYYRYIRLYRIIGISLINFLMGQIAGACSLFFTENYNGKRGINLKYVFYCFYPVHLLILYVISYLN